ncbi:reverse transcriptase domain-containing protein [Tanacetum coccineum]
MIRWMIRTMAYLLHSTTEGVQPNLARKRTSSFILNEGIDLVSKFINQFFPPSKTTNLRNEITRFQQRFDESFYEAWDRFNDLLRACPHHGFSELHQLDTFYNALNANDQVIEFLLAAVVAKVSSNSSTPGISPDVAALTTKVSELKNMMKTMLVEKQKSKLPHQKQSESLQPKRGVFFNQAPAYPKQVHQGQIYSTRLFKPLLIKLPSIQALGLIFKFKCIKKEDFQAYVKANDAVMRNMQTQGQNMQNQLTNLTDMLSKFVTSNTASTSGTLPSNTVTNPKEDLKGITTRSGVAYKGPTIHTTSSPKVVEREPEVTKDTMPPTNNGSTEDVQPPVVPVVHHESISEPVNAPVSASRPNQKASIPFPSRRNDERRREKANDQIEKFYEIFRDLSFEISFTDALMLMPKFASTLKTLIGNKEKLSEMARTPLNVN